MMLAMPLGMAGVMRFEDLDAWKLAVELRDLVYRLTDSGKVLRDTDFRSQIRDSASSPPRNISEGVGPVLSQGECAVLPDRESLA
jgi:hypothetical protein